MNRRNLIGLALLGALVLCVAFSGCGKKANPLNAGTGVGPAEAAATLPHVSAVISAKNGGALLDNSDQIVVVFDKPMDPATISGNTISVTAYGTGENGLKAGFINYYRDENRAVFTPTTSFANTTGYLVTVTTGAQDLKGKALDGNGNNLAEVWNYDNFRGGVFTAGGVVPDITPPQVFANNYGPTSWGNATNTPIFVVFTTNDLDWGSLQTADAFAVYDAAGNKVGTGPLTVDSVNIGGWRTRAAYNTTSLSPGVVYTVKLLSTVKDRSGNTLDGNGMNGSEAATWDDVEWPFCTLPTSGSGAPPIVSSASISPDNLVLTVNFSQSMNISTFTSSNVKVYLYGNKTGYILGTIRWKLAGDGYTYSLENAPSSGPLYIWVSRNVSNSLLTGFKLDSNGNGVGGEEGISPRRFGSRASDDFFGQVR